MDYIVVLTDMCIDKDEQQGLYDYLSRGKSHKIFSFDREGTLKGLRVQKIKTGNDIVNAVANMIN